MLSFQCFNSIKVRLRLEAIQNIIDAADEFSIKTTTNPNWHEVKPFQFIKVRLRPAFALLVMISGSGFNSIKVRLRLTTFSGAANFLLFQFHKGSIKTLKAEYKQLNSDVSIP